MDKKAWNGILPTIITPGNAARMTGQTVATAGTASSTKGWLVWRINLLYALCTGLDVVHAGGYRPLYFIVLVRKLKLMKLISSYHLYIRDLRSSAKCLCPFLSYPFNLPVFWYTVYIWYTHIQYILQALFFPYALTVHADIFLTSSF